MAGKDASELDKATEAWREEQPVQAPLFAVPKLPAEQPRKGRPVGSVNRRTDQVAALYRAHYGDPLELATKIGAQNILDPEASKRSRSSRNSRRERNRSAWWASLPLCRKNVLYNIGAT